MTRAFVDTGAWLAHLIAEDERHDAARSLFERALREDWELVTTNAVVFETHAFLVSRARNGHSVALGFLSALEAGLAEVERFTEEDERLAIGLVRRHADKGYSLCDAVSFIVMERLRISSALAFDRHFHQYGHFQVLH